MFHEPDGIHCPYCGDPKPHANGKRPNGLAKYRCSNPDCGSYFDEWTNTIFSSCKLPPWKLDLVLRMIAADCLLAQMAEVAELSNRTVYIWRMKIYRMASDFIGHRPLSGTVWIDEKYVPVNGSLTAFKPDGKRYRGLSRNQLCICCGVDDRGRRFAELAGRGHPRMATCDRIYSAHISKGSYIRHDEFNGHSKFIASNGGSHSVFPSYKRESLRFMQPINSFCAQLERKFVVHVGTWSKYVQLYLDWCVFETIMEGMSAAQKVAFILSASRKTNTVFRVKDRYHL